MVKNKHPCHLWKNTAKYAGRTDGRVVLSLDAKPASRDKMDRGACHFKMHGSVEGETGMSRKKPEEVVQGIYAAFGRGDLPGLLSMLASDVQWTLHGTGNIPYGGQQKGKAAVERWFGVLGQNVTFTQHEIDRIVVSDALVFCFGRAAGTATATGKHFATSFLHVWEIHSGLAATFNDYFDSAALNAAHTR